MPRRAVDAALKGMRDPFQCQLLILGGELAANLAGIEPLNWIFERLRQQRLLLCRTFPKMDGQLSAKSRYAM